jgi:hypothetical protein
LFSRPILVTGFNRPDLLDLVLKKLELLECTDVFISIDGPRANFPSDFAKVLECKKIAIKFNANFPERNQLMDSNLGCGLAMKSAIDWFFANVEAGIIIEDDIEFGLPFLVTMDFLLSELKNDLSIGSVTGLNPISTYMSPVNQIRDINFIGHRFFSSWGWATWRNRWGMYEFDLSSWETRISRFTLWRRFGILGSRFLANKFDSVAAGKVDTWDYQFLAMQIRYNLKCVAPIINQIGNLGFRGDATHTNSGQAPSLDTSSLTKTLALSKFVIKASRRMDFLYLHSHYQIPTLRQKIADLISSRYR